MPASFRQRWLATSVAAFSAAAMTVACHNAPKFTPKPLAGDATPIVSGDIKYTLLLLGDAGEMTGADSLMKEVHRIADDNFDRTTVFFLGDNIYPVGLPDSTKDRAAYDIAEHALKAQIAAVGRAKGVFVPGNHDWGHFERASKLWADGPSALRRQADFINKHGDSRIVFAPSPGCGGPKEFRTEGFRILAIDTQWWLASIQTDSTIAVASDSTECRAHSDTALTRVLRRAVRADTTLPLVVVGHHPLASSGRHSGYGVKTLDRLRAWAYRIGFSTYTAQDTKNADNKRFRELLEMGLSPRRPLLYASGHDHDIELREGTAASYFLVTGAGSPKKLEAVTARSPMTLFTENGPGFTRLDAMRDGSVALRIVVIDAMGRPATKHCRWIAPTSRKNQPCQ